MTGTSDTKDLFDYCATGSDLAFRRLVERYSPMVHGVALRMMGNASLAEDVTQSVFVILARKAPCIPSSHLPGWLHNTASHECRNAIRKEARRKQITLQYTEAMNMKERSAELWNVIIPHLDEAVGKLSHEDRQIMILRYFEQRDYREISLATGASAEACKKRAQRALGRLGDMLRKRGVVAGGPMLGTAIATFALLPPSASAATISAAALGSGGFLAHGAPSFFKIIQSMTTKQIATATATPSFQLLTAALPILALSVGTIWTVSQNRAIAALDRETAFYQSSIERISRDPAADVAGISGSSRMTVSSQPTGKIDWDGFMSKINDISVKAGMKRRLEEMSAADLMAQLDAVDELDLNDNAKTMLENLILASLVNKDLKGMMERYSGRVNERRFQYTLVDAFEKWGRENPAEAIHWLNQQVDSGAFDSKSLDGSDLTRSFFEAPMIYNLLATDAKAAAARMLDLPETKRAGIVQDLSFRMKPEQSQAIADLIHATLPRSAWSESMGQVSYALGNKDLDRVTRLINDNNVTSEERSVVINKAFEGVLQDGPTNSNFEKMDHARAWAVREFPDRADSATGHALGESASKGGFAETSALALKYHEQTGNDDILVSYLNGSKIDPTDGVTLLDRIKDPAKREDVRQVLERSAAERGK